MTRILVLIITLSTFISTHTTKAQKTLLYDSIVNIDGVLYHGEFQYYINKKDTIYNGSFNLTQQIDEVSNNNSFSISSVKGQFNKNTPVNEWIIRQGEYTPTNRGRLEDYSYTFKINGSEIHTNGIYKNGVKSGQWEIYEWKIKNSNIQDTINFGRIPYINDTIHGNFSFYDHRERLTGYIFNNFTSDKWLFYSKDFNGNTRLLKEWVFEDNILVKKILYNGDKKSELNLINNKNNNAVIEEMQVSENYFVITDLQAAINNPTLYKEYSAKEDLENLYFKIINELKSAVSILHPISKNKITPLIKAKIYKLPYSKNETAFLKTIQSNYNESNNIIKQLHKDVQINLARLSTRQVAYYMNIAESIAEIFLNDITTFVYHYQIGNLEYVDRNLLIERNITIKDNIDIKLNFNDTITTENYRLNHINKNISLLEQLKVFTDDIVIELNEIKDSVDSYVQDIKKEKDLSEVESILFQKYEETKNLADSLISEQNDDIAGFTVNKTLIEFLDLTVKNYSGLESTEEKNKAIEGTLACISKTESLIYILENAPENYYTIRDAYTREVFNPYTYTNMQEKIKPPIYKAFEEDMLPTLYSKLKSMTCENIADYTENFNILFEGMIKLLKTDTDKLERRVKKAKGAKKAAEVMGFQLNF